MLGVVTMGVFSAIGIDASPFIEEWMGASANKLASLGLNLILLVNLAGAAWLHFRFIRGTTSFDRVERWQTAYIPVYLAWAMIVAVVFPPVFGFVWPHEKCMRLSRVGAWHRRASG